MSMPHHKLVVWQRADDLFIEIHQLTRKTFPSEEKYELSAQLRRAAYSVPANIVEGNARQFSKERFHFLSIASASLGRSWVWTTRRPSSWVFVTRALSGTRK